MYLIKNKPSNEKKILFIHHGSHNGGAPLSMLYTMQGLRKAGYNPVAAVRPIKKLHELYNSHGFETIEAPWVNTFITWSGSEGKRYNPIMWKGVLDAWRCWSSSKHKLKNFIKKHKIDVVHLNSVSLSNAAIACEEIDIPYVWHVREHGPNHQGFRYRFIRKHLLNAKKVIFLSKAEQRSWTGGNTHGSVVHNFIDFKKFDSTIKPCATVAENLKLDSDKKIILFVGGIHAHKGIIPLLEALVSLRKDFGDNFYCLMPDSYIDENSQLRKIEKKAVRIITENDLQDICKLLPFNPNIVNLFSLCDVLVFPATKPHFARPIVEASAMGKPVIGSKLAAIDELILDNVTGFLVPPDSSSILKEKLLTLFNDKELCKKMGKEGRKFAFKNFNIDSQMMKIIDIYKSLLR